MSSEEEATAANVLSQMAQIQQINPCDTIEASVVVGHHCDVETTGLPVETGQPETTTVEVTADVLQQVQAAFQQQQELQPTIQAALIAEVAKPDGQVHMTDGLPCTVCTKTAIPQGGKSYICEHCGKKFNKSYNLKTHIRVHTGERPYQCEVCGHGFANLGDLKRHDRTHTGEKPFKCEHCDKVFSDFGSHKRHIRLHTGYKPFKCSQCEREFTRLDSYKNHIRLHTGDRPYKCDTCGKQFNYLTTYKRHLNIHRGEKPYACHLCDKKFTRQNYLKNHLNTHSRSANNESQTDMTGLVVKDEEGAAEEIAMDTSEGQTAAENLNRVEGLEEAGTADKGVAVEPESPSRQAESKSQDASLLQQVTQVLGEIIPHNVSAEVLESAGGPQIVVQGADQAGGEFKITLAQQLLIAQHLLNQANIRSGNDTDTRNSENEQPQITAVTFPDISPELAEQIVSQAGLQHGEPGQEDIQVIELSTNRTPSATEGANGQEIVVTQEQISEAIQSDSVTEQVIDENVVVTSSDGSSLARGDAVYVAIDPSQPEVQQILGQIQIAQDSNEVTVTQSDKST